MCRLGGPVGGMTTTALTPSPTPGCGSGGATRTRPRSAAEVAAAGHATRRPPVWWLATRVRRERADAIAAYHAEIALRARHARIAATRTGFHLGPTPYGYTLTP